MIITEGTTIMPETIGAFMACGISEIEVCKKPLVGMIPTGDEIIPFKKNPKAGEIIEFNSSIFGSMLKE